MADWALERKIGQAYSLPDGTVAVFSVDEVQLHRQIRETPIETCDCDDDEGCDKCVMEDER